VSRIDVSNNAAAPAALQLSHHESSCSAILREYLAILLQETGLHAAARNLRARPLRKFAGPATTANSDASLRFAADAEPPSTPAQRPFSTAAGIMPSLIVDSDTERHLQFSPDALQSRMRLDDPYALIAPYTRQMMSFLLFNPDPADILMIGLGGGSLAKFCYRHLPNARITVIEIDARVIALRDSFYVPADDDRFRVIHDDGVKYLARLQDRFDAILVDAYDETGVAPSLAAENFFPDAARSLKPDGVLIMNLHGDPEIFTTHLKEVRIPFNGRALLVSVASGDNALLCTFGANATPPCARHLFLRARYLQSKLNLHFRSYLQRMRDGITL
jgi:spermidine synthase